MAERRLDRAPLQPTLALSLAMALSGTAGLFSIQSDQPTVNVVFFRCLLGGLALVVWCQLRGHTKELWRFDRTSLPVILVSGLCLVLNWAALFEAFRLTSIGFATIVYHVQPFWIVLAGGLLLGEAFSRSKLGWVLVAFLGLVLVVWPKVGAIQVDQNWFFGTGYALLASLLYAGSTVTARSLKSIKPETLSTLHCGLGVVIFAPFLDTGQLARATTMSWAWLVGLGVIHTGVVYVLLYASYPRLRMPVIAVCAFLNPAAALLCDLVVYDRAINLVQCAGLACITIAALGVNLDLSFFDRHPRRSKDTH